MDFFSLFKDDESLKKVKYDIVPYTIGRGIHVGCNVNKPYAHFIGVDRRDQWAKELNATDEYVLRMNMGVDCDPLKLEIFSGASLDFVFCHNLSEYGEIGKPLKEWWRVIKQGGYLVVCFGGIKPGEVIVELKNLGGFNLVENEKIDEIYFQVYQKRSDKKVVHSWNEEKPKKTCCIVRLGAIGDMIQVASILPGLKRQGYHITMNTVPEGKKILEGNPNVDDWLIQKPGQIPAGELPYFWDVWSAKYDKWINLCESVEGSLLVTPGRMPAFWPTDARNYWLGHVNYQELLHMIAGVPLTKEKLFYPSKEERKKAKSRKKRMGDFVICWAVEGSSVHKHWPYMDNAIARILLQYPQAHIVLVAGDLGQILEMGWENEPRVHQKCGVWSIRETLAFAQQCDMVIGPETGTLNAVAFDPMPKIVFLSHSSHENLTKHWQNTVGLEPEDCKCFPCHLLHNGWETCKRSDIEIYANDMQFQLSGADCQVKIDIDDFWRVFNRQIGNIERAA